MRYLTLLIPLFIIGCASPGYFLSGGDRAAGSVTMLCNYDILTSCQEPDLQALQIPAIEACRNWGYTGAQPFGGLKKTQTDEYTGYIEVSYQCIGHLEKSE